MAAKKKSTPARVVTPATELDDAFTEAHSDLCRVGSIIKLARIALVEVNGEDAEDVKVALGAAENLLADATGRIGEHWEARHG